MSAKKFCARLALAAALVMPAILVYQQANATMIPKCKTIKKSGFYTVKKNLKSRGGDCLIVTAPNVTLFIASTSITGDGSGIGLHITNSAKGFRCFGDSEFANFVIGIQDDADGATIEGVGADHNADTGIFVNGASNVTVGQFGAGNNGKYGLHVLSASHTMVHSYGANSNGTYGVFIEASDHSLLDQFQAGDGGANVIAGVYLGCSVSGPGGVCGSLPSPFNVVSHGSQKNNKYGLVVDGNSNNNVLADTLENGNVNADVFDGNPNCANNLWFFDNFVTSNNPSCMNQQ